MIFALYSILHCNTDPGDSYFDFFSLHDMMTKFIGHVDIAFLNIAICYFHVESLLPWQQHA
jgi:hypothetical protein